MANAADLHPSISRSAEKAKGLQADRKLNSDEMSGADKYTACKLAVFYLY